MVDILGKKKTKDIKEKAAEDLVNAVLERLNATKPTPVIETNKAATPEVLPPPVEYYNRHYGAVFDPKAVEGDGNAQICDLLLALIYEVKQLREK